MPQSVAPTTKIPTDIMEAALRAANSTRQDGNECYWITSTVGVDVIANAILAERQRCADIVRNHYATQFGLSDLLASAILSPAEKEAE